MYIVDGPYVLILNFHAIILQNWFWANVLKNLFFIIKTPSHILSIGEDIISKISIFKLYYQYCSIIALCDSNFLWILEITILSKKIIY